MAASNLFEVEVAVAVVVTKKRGVPSGGTKFGLLHSHSQQQQDRFGAISSSWLADTTSYMGQCISSSTAILVEGTVATTTTTTTTTTYTTKYALLLESSSYNY